jgi:acetylornithine/N-succinyldiaminopimelate aminotransferase
LLQNYARADIAFERGDGAWLTATNGERYLDFGAGIAVNSCGHSHPHLVKTLQEQGAKLWHSSNLFQIPEGERLAKRLTDASFADVVFFCNSGAEANEAAIKMARKFHAVNGAPERFRIVTFEGAFHGRTLATIAAGGQQKYLEGFGPKVEGFDQVPFGDVEALKAAIGPATAALMIEPIQGEGGLRAATPAYLKALRALCDEHGLLLIFDEVQTGIGRTGTLFAYEHMGVTPDILTSAKGLGGGFPVGACLASAHAAQGLTPGTHGTTFGGNPLAMAVANAVLDVVLAPGFLDAVKAKGLLLAQRLAELKDRRPDVIADIRGEGLIMGLKIDPRTLNAAFAAAGRAEHVLTIPAGDNVVRLLPPLTIGDDELIEGVRRLDAACARVERERAADAGKGAA